MRPNDLKLRISVKDQQLTLWEILRQEQNYIMFRASVTSGKKKPDGTWDNINQTFTCFANGEAVKVLNEKFAQKAKVKISGSLTMMPEKRTATGRNGNEYQESIFSNATLNVDQIEFLEPGENFSGNSGRNDADYSSIDDDIPF